MTKHAYPYALMALVVLGGGVAWMECGKAAVCGNLKVESGEQCDKGPENGVESSGCSAQCQFANVAVASIQVSYSKLLNEVPNFNGVACNDLGIGGAHVVLSGPQPVDEQWMGCTQSKMYANVMPGTYSAKITLLDATGTALTKEVVTATADVVKGPVTNLSINFKQADFVKQDYTGQLDWNPSWGMADKKCADSSVSMEQVTLKNMSGMAVSTPAMTSDGLKVNGPMGPCFAKDATTLFQRIGPLPWGHYMLGLVGKNSAVAFCKTFELFVAPGVSPETYELIIDPYDPNGDAGACP
jgi:cysteine-rich repeat protein